MTFKDLRIGQIFEFTGTKEFPGMEQGPWCKISAKRYKKDTNPFAEDTKDHAFWNDIVCRVGSINVEVTTINR